MLPDSYGNTATTFNGDVTLVLASNPTGATLGGTLTVAAVNGVATFSNLTIDKPGSGYTLTATSTGLTSATSFSFDVVADHLAMTTQPPGSITAGVPFGLVVAVENADGSTDTSYNGTISVLDEWQSLGRTLRMTAVAGVASSPA